MNIGDSPLRGCSKSEGHLTPSRQKVMTGICGLMRRISPAKLISVFSSSSMQRTSCTYLYVFVLLSLNTYSSTLKNFVIDVTEVKRKLIQPHLDKSTLERWSISRGRWGPLLSSKQGGVFGVESMPTISLEGILCVMRLTVELVSPHASFWLTL